MTSKRAASSTPTLSHATPRAIPSSASSENLHLQTHTRERQRRASGTPTSLPRRESESVGGRSTRARVGPLPKNGPGNPLFPPLPPKVSKPRTSSQMKLERMEGVNKIEEGDDEEQVDPPVKEEEGKDPEDWEEYSSKQRKQRGFANAGDEVVEADAKEEQQTREEDHETMTSGLSENEAGNESGEEGQVDDAKSTVTVTAEPEQISAPSETKPQGDDAESQTSSEKRSFRTRGAAESSTHPVTKQTEADPHGEAIDVDGDIKPSPEDVEEGAGKEEDDEFSPDGLVGRETAGQVDANGDVTRCICGREADIDAMMIQCDHCNVWQHGACVGIWGDEEAPDEYFCELCKPNLHAPLKRFLRHRQKQGLGFAVPTPTDLKQYYYHSDRNKPSQSKRWTDPSVIKDESMSPPPPAATTSAPQSKPPSAAHGTSSRSHKAKAHSPAVDARRSVGAGHRALSGVSDKSHTDFKVPSGTSVRPGGTSTRRFSNTSSSDSPTSANGTGATGTGKGKDVPLGPVKKRSTMNSRDAAYEEAIAASLREAAGGGSGSAGESVPTGTRSRRGVTESQEYAQEEEDAARKGKKSTSSSTSVAVQSAASRGVKRSRLEEEEVDEAGDDVWVAGGSRKGKKKKEKDDEANKPKHPNQYTYRPKTGTSGSSTATLTQSALAPPEKPRAMPHSPSKKQASSAVSGSNAASRRLGGGGTRGGTPSSVSGSTVGQGSGNGAGAGSGGSLSWNLPDHLAPFAYTLPPNPPSMLEIITPRPPPSGKFRATLEQTASMNQDSGNGEPPTHFEAPTKIRYPTKRMTIGEMRKRVRNLLEFVGRVQGEEDKRGERAKLLNLGVSSSAAGAQSAQAAQDTTQADEIKVDADSQDPTMDTMDVDVTEPAAVTDDNTNRVGDAKPTGEEAVPMNVDDAADSVPSGESGQVKTNPAVGAAVPGIVDQFTARAETSKPEVGVSQEEADAPRDEEIAIPAVSEPSGPTTQPASEENPRSTSTVPPPTAPTKTAAPVDTAQPPQSKSSQLLAELTSDLIRFQMMFEVGGSVFAAPQGAGMSGGGGEEE